jgi:signal transduction histidine kinase
MSVWKRLLNPVHSLEMANADKTRIFSIIAHDLRSPFNSLISLFSLNDMDLLTFDDVKMLLSDSRKSVDNIHNTLNNLLYWAQSQMKGIITTPTRFNMRVMVEDLMLVYQPLIRKKDIKTHIVVDDDDDVFADLNQINLVMRNLIDNAIKFTPLGCYINIRIWGNTSYIYIDVCNPVSNILNVDRLIRKETSEPSYGTSNERGVGLGLHLCRDFVEKNKGQLKVSKEEECVVLRFNLLKFVNEPSAAVAVQLMDGLFPFTKEPAQVGFNPNGDWHCIERSAAYVAQAMHITAFNKEVGTPNIVFYSCPGFNDAHMICLVI